MRALLAPEVYRRDDLSANGTVNDMVAWVREWLARDDGLHVYWLLPPRETAGYDAADVCADRDRVTLLEAPGPADRGPELLTEAGYTAEQLRAIREGVHDPGGYVDVAVDGHRTGRSTLQRWLLAAADHWAADVRPVDVVAHVHDLQMPFKYRWATGRDAFQSRMEMAQAALADGVWFKAGADADALRDHATEFLRDDVVADALAGAVDTSSPMAFDRFEESYADRPEWLHVAGSGWEKKHADRVLAVAERLRDEYGVKTVMTSMDDIPARYAGRPWVEAYPNASRETYETALRRGDLAVCASEYETLARTPFEQAASGQVLVLRDEPWIYDCVPDDHPLTAEADALGDLAAWVVEHWDEAVEANRGLVRHVEAVRDPGRAGERTHRDLRRRVEEKRTAFDDEAVTRVVERTLADAGDEVALDELDRLSAAYTDDGRPLTERETATRADRVYALRARGYRDAGNPGVPVFRAG